MKRFIFVSLLLITFQQTYAQKKTLPNYPIITVEQIVNEAKSGVAGGSIYNDTFDGGENGVGTLNPSPLLQLPELKELVARDALGAWWSITWGKESNRGLLCLVALKANKNISQDKLAEIESKLAEKYGRTPKGAIKATWFTGDLNIFYSTQPTVVGRATKDECRLGFVNGVETSRNFTPNYRGAMEFSKPDPSVVVEDGEWYADGYNLSCLTKYLNEKYRPQTELNDMLLLLTTSNVGESHLTDLKPKNGNGEHLAALAKLKELIGQLPGHSFGFLITEDRRLYSGRFIEASYSKDGGWRLTEIFFPSL